jgi:outer membrane protein assembly factor BamB
MRNPTSSVRLIAVVAAVALVATSCWVGLGFNYANSRANTLESTITAAASADLAETWSYDEVDGVTSTPVVFGGDGEGDFYALNRHTGAIEWSVNLDSHPHARIFGSPVTVDGLVIIGVASCELAISKPDYTFRGAVVAFDAVTGTELWRTYTTTNDAQAAPLSDALLAIDYTIGTQDVVGVGDKAGVYAALDRDTGATVWARQLTTGGYLGGIMMTSAYANGVIYASPNVMVNPGDYANAANTSQTFAIDATDGSIIWEVTVPAASFVSPTVAGDVLYQPTTPGPLYAPCGFWFFGQPPNPAGGLIAFKPDL